MLACTLVYFVMIFISSSLPFQSIDASLRLSDVPVRIIFWEASPKQEHQCLYREGSQSRTSKLLGVTRYYSESMETSQIG